MQLLRFLGQLFVLISIFAGTAAMVGLAILAVRFWPLLLTLILALVIFHFAAGRAQPTRY
ncbi:hypothetical protein [Pseudomonas aeruginosa]|uniref:Uncharacterized protein n=1 Tax=Pseudomonas aeruginosa TaxID=287 RepID=A0A3M5E0B6_PSEAI|nr:hypothetical protein [Pseudomonas aeruginosa]EKW2906514.1 hypothetical protein [Pseudomonas aeruginosa]MBG6951323.1 hypothetical protein [Pseudomonas aeruginosa]MDI2216072.1 hypothetical protein [Pseudomonas aeruginosa]MXU53638.1 hypothetical protein [Pseudomonas aeruginosa]RIY83559.1 hypothetical protein AXW95_11665 [Pseudomonas aeruginosa]